MVLSHWQTLLQSRSQAASPNFCKNPAVLGAGEMALQWRTLAAPPRLDRHPPHGHSRPWVTLVPESPTPSSGLHDHCIWMQSLMQAKHHTYKNTSKFYKKAFIFKEIQGSVSLKTVSSLPSVVFSWNEEGNWSQHKCLSLAPHRPPACASKYQTSDLLSLLRTDLQK